MRSIFSQESQHQWFQKSRGKIVIEISEISEFNWVFGHPENLTLKFALSIFVCFIFFSSKDRSIHDNASWKSSSSPLHFWTLYKNTKIAKIYWFQYCGTRKLKEWSRWQKVFTFYLFYISVSLVNLSLSLSHSFFSIFLQLGAFKCFKKC